MLHTKYAYTPFDDPGLLGYVRRTVRSFHRGKLFADKFDQTVRVHDPAKATLRDVPYNKQLYIFGHGSAGSDVISDNAHNRLSLADIPGYLILDGLSTVHEVVKLFSCQSAQGDLIYTMASKLSRHMTAFFPKVVVYGYVESLLVEAGGSSKSKRGVSGKRAKDLRVGFKNGQPYND